MRASNTGGPQILHVAPHIETRSLADRCEGSTSMAALSTLASKVSFFVWSCFPSGEIPKPPNCWKIVSRAPCTFRNYLVCGGPCGSE